ncbi:MAG: hypothetical protein D4R68_05510 [Ignavibacteriales bacterium]|nr:MAG: hypothetical protein D4R68_05510 [Ignavibacteriales bacterium]
MNTKKLIIAVLAVFVLLEVTGYLIHSVILASTYMQETVSKAFRPMAEMQAKMWRMWIADFVFSFFFVFIFTKGYQNKGIMEGVRYGVYIALFMNFMSAVAQNVIYPVPFSLALQWFIYGSIQMVLLGVVAAFIYKHAVAKSA